MKKLIPVILIVVSLSVFSCGVDREYQYLSIYRYKNQTENVIEMKIFSKDYINQNNSSSKELFLVIPAGSEYELRYTTIGASFRDPLYLFPSPAEKDSVIISNGSRFVVERRWEKDKLYFKENYELIEQKEFRRTYRFVFTDAYFENGEPVE